MTGGYKTKRLALSITAHSGKMAFMSKMNFFHYEHGCALFSMGNKKFIAVAGGNSNITEIMDVENNMWNLGIVRYIIP